MYFLIIAYFLDWLIITYLLIRVDKLKVQIDVLNSQKEYSDATSLYCLKTILKDALDKEDYAMASRAKELIEQFEKQKNKL